MAFSRESVADLVTTRWVLAEVADALSAAAWKDRIGLFLEWTSGADFVTVCGESDRWFERGLALYRSRTDKDWSLTDCISFAVMNEEGIEEALTADHHFTQAGFAALLTDR